MPKIGEKHQKWLIQTRRIRFCMVNAIEVHLRAFLALQKMVKIGKKVKVNPFTFWPILATFSSAEKYPKMHFYDLCDAKNVLSAFELTIVGVSSQFSAQKKMAKISQKVKGNLYFLTDCGRFLMCWKLARNIRNGQFRPGKYVFLHRRGHRGAFEAFFGA